MNQYQAVILPYFLRQLKDFLKKYHTLKDDVVDSLEKFDPALHPHLGKNVYKVRLKSRSLPRGKSKSFRLIVLLVVQDALLTPVTLYFKGDQSDIAFSDINRHLANILSELEGPG